MFEQSTNEFTQNTHKPEAAEAETGPEAKAQAMREVSQEVADLSQENNGDSLNEYFHDALANKDGTLSAEKQLAIFEVLSREQSAENFREAAAFGEAAFAELEEKNDSLNKTVLDADQQVMVNANKLDYMFDQLFNSRTQEYYSRAQFLSSYEQIVGASKEAAADSKLYKGSLQLWKNTQSELATELKNKARVLGGKFEDHNSAMAIAKSEIGGDKNRDLTLLIDEAAISASSERLKLVVGKSVENGVAPEDAVLQELYDDSDKNDAGEEIYSIIGMLNSFDESADQTGQEIISQEEETDEIFGHFVDKSKKVDEYVEPGSRDEQYEAGTFNTKQRLLLDDYVNGVGRLSRRVFTTLGDMKSTIYKGRDKFSQDKNSGRGRVKPQTLESAFL